MKNRTAIAATSILSLALGLDVGGCGAGSSTQSSNVAPAIPPASAQTPALAWKNDGNSLVPFCFSASAPSNCISNFTIRDVNTGTTVTVPITANSYGPVNSNDTYEIRVDGFDGNGNPISSPYAAFSIAQ